MSDRPHAAAGSKAETPAEARTEGPDFIRVLIAKDIAEGKNGGRVHTRFPPEPNGFLHIGHAKAICLNFGVAEENGGKCNLRFDDTNPAKEDPAYVDAIKKDIRWLGFDWDDREFHASDYYQQLYEWAQHLIREGKAYVCSLTEEQTREYRGTVQEAGRPSPDRDRSVEESLDLFTRMRAGEFADGKYTLRAKIDMAAANMKMRDPLMYRIRHTPHHRTGEDWPIYPFYDFAHGQSDAIEGITHSLCTLEFSDNRELYNWYIDNIPVPSQPKQTEFARLNLTYTIMSKRKLLRLVEEGVVDGWDDPRMPTLAGYRRKGYAPEAIREFCNRIGVAKYKGVVDIQLLEHCMREAANATAPRVMAVLKPLRLVIENYPEGQVEEIEAENNPEDPGAGVRKLPFSREVYVERDDFREDAPRKWFRLAPGKEVRLKHAYLVTCNEAIKDASGEVVELRCTYDPESTGGAAPDGRKVRGTLHWVSAEQAIDAEVRLYDHLFKDPLPGGTTDGGDFMEDLNPDSLEVLRCKVEPSLATAEPGSRVQFLRHGYFAVDRDGAKVGMPVFNRTVPLRDSWAKLEQKLSAGGS